MSTNLTFDATAAAQVQAVYATPDVAATRAAAFRAASPRIGENALDLGCGPGFLLRDLALAVGSGGSVVGVDISEPMLALAALRCVGLNSVRLERSGAKSLPFAHGAFDLACALQVYAYVEELDEALIELSRVVKPGGRVVILDTDFSGVIWESGSRQRMQKILAAYEGHVAWPDLPRILPRRLRAAGFKLERCEIAPILTVNYHPNTYVFGLARFIHRFVTEQAGIRVEEADAWLAEMDALEREKAFLFAINRFIFTATRP
jgi:SAM-dependent methyltransferase